MRLVFLFVVLLIILKVAGVLNASWLVVLTSPIWIPLVFVGVVVGACIALVIAVIALVIPISVFAGMCGYGEDLRTRRHKIERSVRERYQEHRRRM